MRDPAHADHILVIEREGYVRLVDQNVVGEGSGVPEMFKNGNVNLSVLREVRVAGENEKAVKRERGNSQRDQTVGH